ncbi:MAG: hypothetical protein ACRBBJ_10040 [Rhodomicrobiaceae bacterium]
MTVGYELFNGCETVFETPDDGFSYFFGYYDKSPLNDTNDKLLAHRVAFDGRPVKDGDTAEIGYFDLISNEFIKINETLAWNWQQGSQLQWLPSSNGEKVIYNDIEKGSFVSRIIDISSREIKTIPSPIYVVHPNGKEALGINYERHYWCRDGYNYQNIKNSKWDKPSHVEDGIYHINLETGGVEQIIKITDIIAHTPIPEFKESNNWLEHLMYNSNGSRFLFFHRWSKDEIDHSRVYIANSKDGMDLQLLPDSRFYSHCCWKNNTELTIWTYPPKKSNINITKVTSKIDRNGFIYQSAKYVVNLFSHKYKQKIKSKLIQQSCLINFTDHSDAQTYIGNDTLYGNGHQTWNEDKNQLLLDTYQDENNYRKLMLFNNSSNNLTILGKFNSTYNDSEFRCDLHPRYSFDKQFIVIDSAHKSSRKLMVLRVPNV